MKTSSISKTIGLRASVASAVLGLAMISAPAFAQDKPAADDAADAKDEIVVTGSLIKDPNIVSSSPVSVIGANEMELRQSSTAESVLRSLPGAVPNIGSQVNNGNGGASFVDLRGLGSGRSLVLLDGARLAPAGLGSAFDLNNVPLALVDRIDALTGGASTTYGADAVAGVVNFVTKRNFSGVEISASEGITDKGDGNSMRGDLTVGGNFADDKGNAVLSIGYQKTDPVYQGDRGYSLFGVGSFNGKASGGSATSVPTAFVFDDGSFLQLNSAGTALVPQYASFNFNPYNIFQTPFQRYNIYGAANYEVSDKIEVYARGLYSHNSVKTIIAPSGLFGNTLTINANNPFLPTAIRDQICVAESIPLGAACNTNAALPLPGVYRRTVEIGPRISDFVTNFFDFKAGMKYTISDHITADIYAAYGQTNQVQHQTGYVNTGNAIQQALTTVSATTCTTPAGVTTQGCVPLNLFGPAGSITPAMAAWIGATSLVETTTSLGQVHGVIAGDLGFSVPSASSPVKFAIGSEYRRYTAAINPDDNAKNGLLGGGGGKQPPIGGAYSAWEAFGELITPIASGTPGFHDLSVETGVRYSNYKVDAAGNPSFSATTYKAGLNWAPVEGIKLRANYQHAVRAPTIGNLFSPSSTGLTSLSADPCSVPAAQLVANPVGPVLTTLGQVCAAQGAPLARILAGTIPQPVAGQANVTGGGNPLLKPEKADTLTVGVVLQPKDLVPGLTVSVDYYNIRVKEAISSPVPADILDACFKSPNPTSVACTSIRRNLTTGGLSGNTNVVPGLPSPLSNTGRLKTDGIDIAVNYRRNIGFADLDLSFNGNITNKSTFQASPSGYERDCVGYFSANCGSIQPKFQFNQRTTLKFGKVDVSLLWTHIGSVNYEGSASDFLARGFTNANHILFAGTITNLNSTINSSLAGQVADFNKIKAYDYFDLSTRFHIGDHIDLTMTVNNLFDRQPPVIGSATGTTAFNSGNTFPSTYDPLGRRYSATVKLKF